MRKYPSKRLIKETKAMNKYIIESGNKTRVKDIEVEVSYLPFPSEKARDEAYSKWVKAFLSAKMRQLRQERQDELDAEKSQGAGI